MQSTRVLTALIAFGATAMGADPGLLTLLMPGAKVVSGVNVLNAKGSPFGQFLVSQIESKDYAGLQKLTAATGFNPFTDVSEILAATAADPAHPGGIVTMSGNFNVQQIVAAVAGNQSITVVTSGKVTLLTFVTPKAKVTPALAFIGTSIAIAGDSVSVNAALDQNSGGSAASLDPGLANQISTLSANDDAWFVSSAPVTSLLPANVLGSGGKGLPGPASQVLSSVQSFSGGVKFGESNQLTAELVENSPQNAAALGSVVKLLVGMLSMNGGTNAPKNPQLAVLLPLLQSLQVTTTGNDVDLALSVPESQLELLAGSHSGN